GQRADLPAPIGLGDRRQDGLEEPAAPQLDLTTVDQGAQRAQVVGMVERDPLEQRSAMVECQPHRWPALEEREEWRVGVIESALKHAVEVPDRLMVVDDEGESDRTPAHAGA